MSDGPALAWQGSLLGGQEPSIDTSFTTLARRSLDHGAWVDEAPGWLTGADVVFEQLLAGADWEAREMPMYGQQVAQPRLSAWWPLGERTDLPVVAHMASALSDRYGVAFDSVGLNLYRDGRDSVAAHGDRHARRPNDPDALVAIVSLGSPRRLTLKPRGGGPSVALRPDPGDLLVMGGSCQRTWQHGVPKVASADPRISVTFRHPVR